MYISHLNPFFFPFLLSPPSEDALCISRESTLFLLHSYSYVITGSQKGTVAFDPIFSKHHPNTTPCTASLTSVQETSAKCIVTSRSVTLQNSWGYLHLSFFLIKWRQHFLHHGIKNINGTVPENA